MKKRIISGLLVLSILFSLCLSACGKSKEAQAVDDMIANLGVIDLKTGDASIAYAEEAFKALSDKDQESLENLEELHEARRVYDELLAEEERIRSEAKEIEDAIDKIGKVSLSSLSDIRAAREKYDEADPEIQEAVTNYDDLLVADILFGEIISNCTDLINYIKDTPYIITHYKSGLPRKYYQGYALTFDNDGLVLIRHREEWSQVSKENITFLPVSDTFVYELDFEDSNTTANGYLLARTSTYSGKISKIGTLSTLSEDYIHSPNGFEDFNFGDRAKRINEAYDDINEMLDEMKIILASLPLIFHLGILGLILNTVRGLLMTKDNMNLEGHQIA